MGAGQVGECLPGSSSESLLTAYISLGRKKPSASGPFQGLPGASE